LFCPCQSFASFRILLFIDECQSLTNRKVRQNLIQMKGNYCIFITVEELQSTIKSIVSEIVTSNPITEPTKEQELITRKETAKILGVSLPTLDNWSKLGILKSYKIATRVRYNRDEVLGLFQTNQIAKFGRRAE
jgi:uncharacterized membrane protein